MQSNGLLRRIPSATMLLKGIWISTHDWRFAACCERMRYPNSVANIITLSFLEIYLCGSRLAMEKLPRHEMIFLGLALSMVFGLSSTTRVQRSHFQSKRLPD